MRTQWLAVIASAGVMIWSALAGASPSFDPPNDPTIDPPIDFVPNLTPQERDWSSFVPGPIWTGAREDQGDWLYKPFTPTLAIMDDTIRPAVAWTGSFSSIDTKQIVRIDDAKAWTALWTRHRGDKLEQNALGYPVVPEIDFDHWMVVAIFAGDGAGAAGYGLAEAREIEQHDLVVRDGQTPRSAARWLRIRIAARVYQTASDAQEPRTAAYGIFVLPKPDLPLPMRIELAQYHRLDQPPTWKEVTRPHPGPGGGRGD